MKLRQLEHSLHFAETRSERAASLWSELARKNWRCRAEMADAERRAYLASMAAVRADWQLYRTDAVERRMQSGCLYGMWTAVYLRLSPFWRL